MSEQLNNLDNNAILLNGIDERNAIDQRMIHYQKELSELSGKTYDSLTPKDKLSVDQAKAFAEALKSGKNLVEAFKDTYIRQSGELLASLKGLTEQKNQVILNTNVRTTALSGEVADGSVEKPINMQLKTAVLEVANDLGLELPGSRIPKDVYKNVTGESLTGEITANQINAFKSKLVATMNFMKSIGINSGFYAVLNGRTNDFVTAVMKLPADQRKVTNLTPEQVSTLTPGVKNAVAGLVTAGVLVATSGIVIASYRENEFNVDEFMSKAKESKDSPVWSFLKDSARYVGLALVGRKLSLTAGQDKELTIDQMNDKVVDFAKKVMVLNFDGKDNFGNDNTLETQVKQAMEIAKKAGYDNPSKDKELMQRALLQNYILTLGKANAGADWKASLSPLFIGANYDNIKVDTKATKLNSYMEKIERGITRQNLTTEDLNAMGCKIERNADGKYKHIIPSKDTLQFPGDDKAYPLNVVSPNGVDLSKSDKVYDFNLSFTSEGGVGSYILNLVERNPQPTAGEQVSAQGKKTQEIGAVKNLRESKETLTTENLPEILYSIGHNVVFGPLLKEASSGDKTGVEAELKKLEKKYSGLVKILRKDIDNFKIWDTYMSGSKETRAKKIPDYDKTRQKGVLKAESALAKKQGFPENSNESEFKKAYELAKKDKAFTGEQISNHLKGQEITAVQFMTPLDGDNINKSREALHRVYVADGSFKISGKTVELSGKDRKQVIDGILNSSDVSIGINAQLTKLNKFLSSNNVTQEVTLESYKDYLASGKLDDLKDKEGKIIAGLSLQEGKEAKVIEARAMVAGNICLNRTYAIGYPAFEFKNGGGKQDINPAGSLDAAASIAMEKVTGTAGDIGVSPLAISNELDKGTREPLKNNVSTTTDGKGTVITQPITPVSAPPVAPNPGSTSVSSAAAQGGGGFRPPIRP